MYLDHDCTRVIFCLKYTQIKPRFSLARIVNKLNILFDLFYFGSQ